MNRLTVYDPFADIFPQVLRGFTQPIGAVRSHASSMRVDFKEVETGYLVQADLPGVGKDNINVEIDGNRLSISANVSQPESAADGQSSEERLLRIERHRGAVTRSFVLENEIDKESATARYENGVLELTLPKKSVAGAKRLAIT